MNFFEQELRRIVGPHRPDAVYAGRACYLRLDSINRARVEFARCGVADQYEALKVTILNRDQGKVDSLLLRFSDLLGKKQVPNPNFPEGIVPCICDDCGRADWYVYQPSGRDYRQLGDAVNDYLDLFQEQIAGQTWEQTM